jgi:uncharacterized protein DUF4956
LFTDLGSVEIFPTTGFEIIGNILVALLCGLFIGWLYRRTYKGPGYSVAFVNSLILLAMLTAMVILVIGNNLARAFGLVGAMSIIRFRTAVKDTLDIVYIFFALVIGMAAGAGYHKIAVLSTLVVGAVIFLLSRTGGTGARKADSLLQFAYSVNGNGHAGYLPVLRKYCRRHTVINTRALEDEDTLELSFYVHLRNEEGNDALVRDLRKVHGVSRVNLYFDEEVF